MKNQIHIEGIHLYAHHGCLEEEGKIGGEYIVDIYLQTDFKEAAIADNLSLTIDYCTVYAICKQEMAIRSKLIEHVGQRIHHRISTTFPQLVSSCVKITKLNPPMNGNVEKVSILIEN